MSVREIFYAVWGNFCVRLEKPFLPIIGDLMLVSGDTYADIKEGSNAVQRKYYVCQWRYFHAGP